MQPSRELLQISLFWDEAGFCYASEEISSLEKRSVIQWSENPPPCFGFPGNAAVLSPRSHAK